MEIIKLNKELFACPTLWRVKFKDNSNGYIRYRFGTLSVYHDKWEKVLFNEKVGDSLDGVINYRKMKSILSNKFTFTEC